MRFIFLFSSLFLFIEARENPFFPSPEEVDITMTSNSTKKLDPLKRATLTLPSTARTIESVTVKYKNLDGSISEVSEELGNSVDWHLPIFVSQNYGGVESEHKKINIPLTYTKIAGLKFIKLYENKSSLKIRTNDKLIRNFLLIKPHRIVCDFKRDINIRNFEKEVASKGVIEKVKLGNHKGYYRVVIELDGHYRYKLQSSKDAYIFKFL
jgi:hypothetical protein